VHHQYIRKKIRKSLAIIISINGIPSRLFIKTIYNKLQESSKDIISKDQNSFNLGQGSVDGIFIIQQVTEKRTIMGEKTHMIFIDLKHMIRSLEIECGEYI